MDFAFKTYKKQTVSLNENFPDREKLLCFLT